MIQRELRVGLVKGFYGIDRGQQNLPHLSSEDPVLGAGCVDLSLVKSPASRTLVTLFHPSL